MDDVKVLLAKDIISPVTLVKRVTEATAFPLMAHPDFQDTWAEQSLTSPSKNVEEFMNKLEESTNAKRNAEEAKVGSALLTQGAKTLTGSLVDRGPQSLRVMTTSLGMRVGQPVDVFLATAAGKERYQGKIKTFVEQPSKEKKGTFVYIYEITLSGIFKT